MKSLAEYLDCGKYGLRPQRDTGEFFVTKFSDITDKIIPKGALRPPTFQPPAAETFLINIQSKG
jgi:hypothetical protein